MKNWIKRKISVIILLISQLVPVIQAENMSNNDDISLIHEKINQFVLATFPATGNTDIDISIADIDPRLKLSACDNTLTYTFTQNITPESLAGRHTVNIQCKSDKPWSIYVPVVINIWQEIPILITSLKRGEVIRSQDISMQRYNIAKLQGKYIDSIAAATGKVSSRTLSAGSALYTDQLSEPELVKKGDQVIVTLQSGSITVSANGTAKQGGKRGDQISVENLTSNRTITGRVIDRNTVSLSL